MHSTHTYIANKENCRMYSGSVCINGIEIVRKREKERNKSKKYREEIHRRQNEKQ